jgi:hypothetical protein
MDRSRILYGILSLLAVVAIGYFAFTYLAPQNISSQSTAETKPASVDFVNGKEFSMMQSFVNLPIKATDVGWPSPFQSIYERGIPGIYVAPVENTNGNTNVNAGENTNTPKQ